MSIKLDLRQAVVDIKHDEIGNLVNNAMDLGLTPLEVLEELRAGLKVVGDRYHDGEYFLSELFMAAETVKIALDIITPLIKGEGGSPEFTIIIGSIEGDIHDFGKTTVSSLLIASGFNVVDIGVDVPAEKFIEEAKRVDADVIGISALLSSTQPLSKKVIEELERQRLRGKFRVILGGTGVDPNIAVEEFGVDAAVNDGSEGVRIIESWMKEKRGK